MSDDEELAKDLGLLSAMTIGIGTMVRAGIFVHPGVAAREAGPIVVVSVIIGGLIAMINALAVSELGTAMPKAGGGYYYVNRGGCSHVCYPIHWSSTSSSGSTPRCCPPSDQPNGAFESGCSAPRLTRNGQWSRMSGM